MDARKEYLRELKGHLAERLPKPEARTAGREAASALDEAFEGLGRPVRRDEIVKLFGEPAEFARTLAAQAGLLDQRRASEATVEPAGRVLGVPYDARIPTAERIGNRMWNPSDPRLFMPRALGLGWDINFGALAVRLGLLRPDDIEDVPFENVPRAVTAVLSIVAFVALVAAAVWAVLSAGELPPRIPTHFGPSGPDEFASPIGAAVHFIGVALVPASGFFVVALRRRSSALARALVAAALPAIAIVSVGFYANAVSWALRGRYVVPAPVPVLVGLVALFAGLLGLAKLGLRREWRRQAEERA